MPEYHVELIDPAWRDLDSIADYHLLEVGPDSSRNITDTLLNALERLEVFPLSCPPVPNKELAAQGYRMLVCGRYVSIYRLHGKRVLVYHIVAAATNYPALF